MCVSVALVKVGRASQTYTILFWGVRVSKGTLTTKLRWREESLGCFRRVSLL